MSVHSPSTHSPASVLATVERAGARRRKTLRWVRPMGFAVLAALLAVGARTRPAPALHGTGLAVLIGLAGVVACLAVLFGARRRLTPVAHLVTVLALVVSSAVLVWVEPEGLGFLGGFVAAGAIAARASLRTGVVVAVIALIVLGVAGLAGADRPVTSMLISELGLVACYRLGWYAREMRWRTEEAEELLVELASARPAQLRAAALAERQRLAREMHDVLAHLLSGLTLHLEGARLLAARESAGGQLTGSIERARHLAEAGLREAREAVGMLRDEDLPGPERLAALAAEFERDTGVPCAVTVTGERAELPARTRLTLYRVAQEALTNVCRHARPERVSVRLRHERDGVRLCVEDTGAPAAGGVPGGGYGVSGMRERAELLGGTLAAGPTGDGFRVQLWVPAGTGEA